MTEIKKVTVSCNGDYETEGYIVEMPEVAGISGVSAVCFTFEQAQEVARLQKELVDEFDGGVPESYALIEYDESDDVFNEVYYDGIYAYSGAMEIEGMKLYAIGMEWDWEVVE